MADEVIGTARIDITASAEGVESAVARSKRSLQDFSKEAQAAYQQADSAAKRATTGLVKWVQQQEALNAPIERTTASLKLFNAAMSGAPLRVLEEARQRIDQLASSQDAAAVAAQRMSDAAAFEKQHLAAQRLVQSSEYVNWWKDALVSAELAEKQLQETRLFEQQNLAAQRLVKSSEYVRWWEDALEKADAAERQISSDKAFLKSLSDRANAAGKTAAEMLELQAAERGLSDQAAPFIARLKEQEGALRRSGAEFNKYGLTAKMEMAALRQVPAQITDIIVSLQGGQRPLTVLLQQGGQLKDVFGGVVPAAKAMAGALVGMINPATMALGAVAGLAAAYYAGATELDAFEKNAIMTGNALGLTADRASVMTKEMAALADISRREAAAALTAVAASGKVASGQIESVAIIAARSAELLGRETSEVVAEFAKLATKPAEASADLNRQYHYLTASVYEQILALETQGRTQDAVRLAQEEFARVSVERLGQVEKSLGYLERGWNAVTGAIRGAASAAANFGRPLTVGEQINQLQAQIRAQEELIDGSRKITQGQGRNDTALAVDAAKVSVERLKGQLADLQAQAAASDFTADAQARAAAESQKRIDALGEWDKRAEQSLSKQAKMEAEINRIRQVGVAAGKSEAEIETQIAAIREKYAERRSGGISATQTELANLKARLVAEQARTEQLTSMGTALSKLNEGEKLALSYAEKSKLATDAKTKAALAEYEALAKRLGTQIRSNDEYEAELKTAESSLKKVQDESRAMKDQISVYGMSKGAIEEMAIARLREREALLAGTPGQEKLLELIRQEIAEREKLGGLLNQYEILEKQRKEWEQWQQDIGQIFDQVGQSLTDALFEGGKSGRDLVKDLFKTLTLRILVQPVMGALQGQVTQQLGGMLGYQNPQQTGTGMPTLGGTGFDMGGSLLRLGANIGSDSLMNFGVGYGLGAGTYTGMLTTEQAAAFMGQGGSTATQVGTWAGQNLGSILGYGSAIFAATQGQYGTAVGTAIGTAIMPGIGTAIGGLLGSFADGLFSGGEPKTTHSQSTAFRADASGTSQFDDDDRVGSDIVGAVRDLTTATRTDLNSMLTMLGTSYQLADIEARIRTTVQGKNSTGSWGTLVDASGRERHVGEGFRQGFDDLNAGDNLVANLQVDLQRLTLSAFRAAADEMPEFVRQAVEGADFYSRADDEVNAVYTSIIALINGAQQLRVAMEALPFDNLHNLSLDAAAGLLQLSGGLENLASAQQTYLQNFYSEAERQQIAVGNLTTALAAAGVEMPALIGSADAMRAQYRALIEAQNLETEAGRQAYIALINNAGAFSQVATYAGQAAASVGSLWDQTVAAGESAYSALSRSVAAEKNQLQKQAEAVAEALRGSISTASDAVSKLTALTGRLSSALSSMTTSQPDAARTYAWAQDRVERALSVAKLTGVMPEGDDFETALQIVSKPTEGLYGSFEEYQADFLKTARVVQDLNDLADGQLSIEQRTLTALQDQLATSQQWYQSEISRLDMMLEEQRKALDIATGQYEALLSIPEALAGIAAAIASIKLAGGGTGGGTGGGAITGAVPGPGEPANVSAGSITSRALDYLSNNPDVATAWNQDSGGLSFQQFAVMHYEKYGQYEGRSFAVGTNYVPYDMTANIHQGEIIIDPRSSDILRRYGIGVQGGGSDATVKLLQQEIRELRQMLATKLDGINRNTGDTARSNQEMAERVQTVRIDGPVGTVLMEDRT